MPATMTSSSNNVRIVFINVKGIYTSFHTEYLLEASKNINVWMTSAKCSPYRHVSVPARLLEVPRVKNMSQHSSCVCSMTIRPQLSPAAHCVYCIHLTKLCVVMTITLLRNVFPHLTVTCISKISSRGIYEGGSNENLKSAIKIRNAVRLFCKLTTMILML